MKLKKYCIAGKKYIFDKDYRFLINAGRGKYNNMPDKEYLTKKFHAYMKRSLDLDNPVTLNEKLQWLKLYYHNKQLTLYVDKYKVREYIKDVIGEEYLIPLLGVWDSPEDIDFESLPNQFVLKCNHNSGTGMYICTNKNEMNVDKVKKGLLKGLQEDCYLAHREWPYKGVPRKIIAEKYMVNGTESGLNDYKFQCFNGKFDSVFVCVGRNSKEGVKYYYFDKDWNYLPYSSQTNVDKDEMMRLKPKNLELMIQLSEKLAEGLPEVRIDLYEINGKIYFGEMTFFTQSGFDTDITYEADKIMGKKITLPEKYF